MMKFGEFHAFMRRYFPTFLLGFFICVMSVALSLAMWIDSHWRNHPDNPIYSMLGTTSLGLLLSIGHFAMIRGWRWAMWAVLPVPVATLLMALSLFGNSLPALLLAAMLALPLLALLVFNSSRHREMRRRLVELRRQR
ncbi:hypothetical protein FEM01_10510 [Pseudomonas mosselii]|uniref:Uncharacterized protein n=2 Tax=Pseudomonas mosselii TaxID=78327 RepID=A0A5R8ZA24_9PSED|nr:hypothetical protein FEM01_10510 [Pseudomonas mosselii]